MTGSGAQGQDRVGGLSKQRAAELARRLRELHRARLVAQVQSRHYPITGSARSRERARKAEK